MCRTNWLSIIRSLNTVFTAIDICRTEILKVGKFTPPSTQLNQPIRTALAVSPHNSVCTHILLYRQNLLHFLKYFYYFKLLYNIEFYPQHVLQFNDNLHIYIYIYIYIYTYTHTHTLVTLPIFKISVWQIPFAVNTVLRLLMMDSKSVGNM
jgi:hypothetical protein